MPPPLPENSYLLNLHSETIENRPCIPPHYPPPLQQNYPLYSLLKKYLDPRMQLYMNIC